MTLEERNIISTIKTNSNNGFKLLMAKYKEAIYWHIRRLVVSHADAQDATQETFVRIFRAINTFKGDSSFTVWIYKIATNEALRLLSKNNKEHLSLDDSDSSVGNMQADNYVDYSDLETVKLQKAILSLPGKQQLAFNMRYYDELSYDEIAEITASTVANVKANYHIAKDKIVKYMHSHD